MNERVPPRGSDVGAGGIRHFPGLISRFWDKDISWGSGQSSLIVLAEASAAGPGDLPALGTPGGCEGTHQPEAPSSIESRAGM